MVSLTTRMFDLSLLIWPRRAVLSGLGNWLYRYFGMMDIGRPQAGETVIVSAASVLSAVLRRNWQKRRARG